LANALAGLVSLAQTAAPAAVRSSGNKAKPLALSAFHTALTAGLHRASRTITAEILPTLCAGAILANASTPTSLDPAVISALPLVKYLGPSMATLLARKRVLVHL